MQLGSLEDQIKKLCETNSKKDVEIEQLKTDLYVSKLKIKELHKKIEFQETVSECAHERRLKADSKVKHLLSETYLMKRKLFEQKIKLGLVCYNKLDGNITKTRETIQFEEEQLQMKNMVNSLSEVVKKQSQMIRDAWDENKTINNLLPTCKAQLASNKEFTIYLLREVHKLKRTKIKGHPLPFKCMTNDSEHIIDGLIRSISEKIFIT